MRRVLGLLATGLILVLVAGLLVVAWLRSQQHLPPLAFEQRCVATTPEGVTVLTLDQAHWTAIVVGAGVRRNIGSHGATIAMATVYQETGIRNLDYGDRDSLGLFQQRPSQGWGTSAEIMDPWHASARFYEALVAVPGWETGDVNDTAQAVQRSGHPEAYRQHEDKARVLAEVFGGVVPAGLTCFDERSEPGDPAAFLTDLHRTFGELPVASDDTRTIVTSPSEEHAWAVAAYAVANAGRLGIDQIETNGHTWRANQRGLAPWQPTQDAPVGTVTLTFR